MKFKLSKSLNIITIIFLSSLLLIIINFTNQNLHTVGVTAIISYIIFFLTWWKQYRIKLNYYTIFLAFTFAFFWGQFILLLLGYPLNTTRVLLDGRIPYNKLIETGVLVLNSMIFLHLGVLFSTFNINKYNELFIEGNKSLHIDSKNNENLKKVGFLLLSISIVPSFYVLFNNITITMSQGYSEIFQSELYATGGFDNIIRFLSLFTFPSFLILFITCKDDRSIKTIKKLFLVYLGFYFISGSRMGGVMLLSILILIKHYWYAPITKKEIAIKYVILFIIGITLMSTISEIRSLYYLRENIGITFTEGIKSVIINNPIFSALRETGFTFIATATVVTYCPWAVPHVYGSSYINSILMIFPNLFWETHPAASVNTDIIFKGFYTVHGGIGSSFIAEAYWNFGNFAIIFALLFGVVIGTLTKKMAKYAKLKNTRMFFLVTYSLQILLTYVRSDTITFWRNITYYGIFPILLAWFLSQLNKLGKLGKVSIDN